MKEINLSEVLNVELIDTATHHFKTKQELFEHAASLFKQADFISDSNGFIESLYEREAEGTTYMGNGLVIPHGKSVSVSKAGVCICRFHPMKYEGEEEELAHYAVVLAVPEKTDPNQYIKLLSSIACSLLQQEIVELVTKEKDASRIWQSLSEAIATVKQ